MVCKNKTKQNVLFNELNLKIKMRIAVFERTRAITNNDLRANEGRETEALNCKPNTNLKEISELSNYCKPAAFVCTLLVLVVHDLVHKVD
jgi:hypothetical protein